MKCGNSQLDVALVCCLMAASLEAFAPSEPVIEQMDID